MHFHRSQPIIALAIMLAGCGTGTVSTSPTSATSNSATEKPAEADDVLTNAIYQLHPENFGINATTDKPVSLLNSWRFTQPDNADSNEQTTSVDVPDDWMTSEEKPRVNQAKYDLADAVHVRDALLHHTIAGYLSDRDRDELRRVVIIVDFVCQNIALWKDNEIEIPLPAFLALQFGRGSADDRVWITAEILRQLRIDSIVLRSKKDTKESTDNWLFGVILNNQVYLFDMKLGLPIPSDAPDKDKSVATLKDLSSHPEWLEELAGNEPYRLSAEEIGDSAIYVISQPNFWCERMRKLEQAMPANDICVLYDPLKASGDSKGLLNRISSTGGWPVDSLKLWGYPRRQSSEFKGSTKETVEELQRLMMPFSVPIPVKTDNDGKMTIGSPERKLQKYRMDQLLGKFTDAPKKYLSIRHLEVEPNPPDIERINRMAAEDTFYWTCQCKYESKDYEAAAEQIQAYLKKYDRKGKWYYPARELLARTYAELGQFPQAVETLQRTSAEDPYRQSNAIRAKRWSKETSKPADR